MHYLENILVRSSLSLEKEIDYKDNVDYLPFVVAFVQIKIFFMKKMPMLNLRKETKMS